MAVLAMKRIHVYALKANRKKILETLQLKNAVEIRSVEMAAETFSKTDTSSARAVFEKNAQIAQNAVNALDALTGGHLKAPGMFSGRTPITEQDFKKISDNAVDVIKTASRIITLTKRAADYQAEKVRYETQIASLEPWVNLDISMRTVGSKSSQAFIGSFPELLTEAAIKEKLAELQPDVDAVDVEVVFSGQQQTCVFVICHAASAMKVESALRLMGFAYPPSPSKVPARERISILGKKLQETDGKIRKAKDEILSYKELREELIFTSDYYMARAEKYRVLGELWQSRSVFLVSGFVPANGAKQIQSILEDRFDAYVELTGPDENEDVPVKLKNNGFASPVEGVVAGYSLPGKGEIDPCSVMAIFYYVLFGMMLSDAAYGFLMTVGCAVILRVCKNMEHSSRNSIKMFMFSGVSTMFWGVMFGSYFGDAIPVIAKTFFNTDIVIQPLWFAPLDEPMRLLMFSMLLGIIHLFTGLAMLLYTHIKNHRYKDALYDAVFWYFLVGGLILALLSTDMFREMAGLTFKLPGIVGAISLVFAAIGAIGIILTAGRESRSPFKRLLKGLYGLYNISGYLSDILSYSRLLALGLATGVIATVFNQMGSMLGAGVVGAIFFTVVFIIGHAMNIAINVLGAYVHTNRLQYVEFFGKFYEGGGKKFEPFSTNTKYMKVTEEK